MFFNRVFTKHRDAYKSMFRKMDMDSQAMTDVPKITNVEQYEETIEERNMNKYAYQKHFPNQEKTLR